MKFPALGLFRRREIWLPTWRGWLVILLLLAMAGAALLFGLYPFLAPNAPRDAGVLVVEGWVDDDLLRDVVQQYRAHHYTALYSTGHPVDYRAIIHEYGTYAEYGAARLRALGVDDVVAVPSPHVARDRTYSSAIALRTWLRAHGAVPRDITVLTSGPHARRSRLLFHRAFGEEAEVGVISLPAREYDTRHWWRSSAGFREVVGEAIAWLYAQLLFRPGGDG